MIKKILFKIFNKIVAFFGKIGINKKTPGALWVYNLLFRLLWPHKSVIEIQGSKMYINVRNENLTISKTLQDYASKKIHEPATTNLFKKILKKGDIVVDLGANIGYFTLLAARLVGEKGKVYAFEPEPVNFKFLKKNIELNNYSQAEAYQMAVAEKSGKTRLYICNYDSGHHTINQFNGIKDYSRGREVEKKWIEVETTSLDKFLEGREKRVDLIKMDIEGAEPLALSGMDKTLRENKNLKMIIEFFPLLIRKMGCSPEEFIRKLMEVYKFSIFVIPGDYNAKGDKLIEIKSLKDILSLCQNKEDHLNLYVKR